ncbi:MAG: hypothetical protein AB8G17_02110 [Gammaproteobacteria bacterium]
MIHFLRDKNNVSAASRWRRQPIYAATRLRCAVAMFVLAIAVVLSALPSFARQAGCTAPESLESGSRVEAPLFARSLCKEIAHASS